MCVCVCVCVCVCARARARSQLILSCSFRSWVPVGRSESFPVFGSSVRVKNVTVNLEREGGRGSNRSAPPYLLLSGVSKLTTSNVVLNVHRNHKAYWGRGEGGGREREWGGGGRRRLYTYRYTRMTPALRRDVKCRWDTRNSVLVCL